jgi:hypothetical protein
MVDSIQLVARFRRIAFFAVVGLLTVAVAIQWWVVTTPALVWFPDGFVNQFFASRVDDFAIHRIHRLATGITTDVVLACLVVQFRRPHTREAAIWLVFAFFAMAVVLNLVIQPTPAQLPPVLWIIFALGVLAGLLHPSSPLFRIPRLADWRLLALTAAMAVPYAFYAVQNVGLQMNGVPSDPHWAGSHYQFAAELGFQLILLGLVSSTAFTGRKFTIWLAGLASVLMGFASMLFPDQTSTLGPAWGMALVAWGIAFVATGMTAVPASATGRAPDGSVTGA